MPPTSTAAGHLQASPRWGPLKDELAARGIDLAVATTWGTINTDPGLKARFEEQIGGIVTENDLLWAKVQPQQGNFRFAGADQLFAWAKAQGMALIGTPLIWPIQGNPSWLDTTLNSSNWQALIDQHFEGVITHFNLGVNYAQDIVEWVVVNEPHGTSNWRADMWNVASGTDAGGRPNYIPYAFQRARHYAPNAQLILNDYNLDIPGSAGSTKRANFLSAAEAWLQAGIPLDAIGSQSHLDLSFLYDSPQPFKAGGYYESFVQNVKSLGIDLVITELDVRTDTVADGASRKAMRAADLVKRFLDRNLINGVTRIRGWGLTSNHHFIRGTLGVLYGIDPLLVPAREPQGPYRKLPAWWAHAQAARAQVRG